MLLLPPRKEKHMRNILALGILLVFGTACGSSTAAPTPEQEKEPVVAEAEPQRDDDCPIVAGIGPRLALVDNWFGPDCMKVRSDATLYVQNLGEYEHSFTISEVEYGSKPFLIDVNLPGGDTKPRAVELDGVLDAGSYEFFCTYHGSMDGVLEVIEPVS
jgi:plastocyanin